MRHLSRHEGCLLRGASPEPPRMMRNAIMSRAPLVVPASALGIVIKSGAPAPKPVRFWAYMWAADEETGDDHWHQHVPTEHAA